jgi:hypothetical protein
MIAGYRLQVDYGQIIGRYNFSVSVPYLFIRDSAGLPKYSQLCYEYGRLDGQQRIVDLGNNPLELSGGFFYRIKTIQYLRAEVFTGLDDSSPELGFASDVTNWF